MRTKEYKITQGISHIVLCIASLLVIVPFALLLIASFTNNDWATVNGFHFLPKEWSLDAYLYILNQKETIGRAYFMTIAVTLVGTVMSLILTTTLAYATSRADIPAMRVVNYMLIFTMLFNGGLVATYYTYTQLFHIRNTFWALVVPGLMLNAVNVILVRNYFKSSIPASLLEAARLDGAGEFRVFATVIIPLSKPILATVGLMTAIGYWNDWQNGMYYLSERGGSQYYTIQVLLNNINNNVQNLANNSAVSGMNISLPSTTIRMAIATIGILPIMIAYPFFQKFFVQGITLGGVKE